MPASGKTTLAAIMADTLNLKAIDLDNYILKQQPAYRSIKMIFENEGQIAFRKMEHEALEHISKKDKCLVATGGGTPCFFDNMELMLERGLTIFLNPILENIYHRLNKDTTRPLFEGYHDAKLLEKLREMYTARLPIYQKSHIVLNDSYLNYLYTKTLSPNRHIVEQQEIEFWENHYLNHIEYILKQDLDKILKGLKSKDKIKDDWFEIFNNVNKQRQNSDFARGAERIFYSLFNQFGLPNSTPIGSDMMFELYNAFIHIDIKTAKFDNYSDYRGKIPVGENQTSYKAYGYTVNLPTKYSYKNKICLTYFINIVYNLKDDSIEIKAITLLSVPNGELTSIYSDDIVDAGKTGREGKGFRYKFSKKPFFDLLEDKPLRVRILYASNDIRLRVNQIIGLKHVQNSSI